MAQTAELMRSMVPIARFDRGEARQIFDEVAQTGIRFAGSNNKPACVLLSFERYEEMVEELEDADLIAEVIHRLENPGETISMEDLMAELGITYEDLDAMEEVELE